MLCARKIEGVREKGGRERERRREGERERVTQTHSETISSLPASLHPMQSSQLGASCLFLLPTC